MHGIGYPKNLELAFESFEKSAALFDPNGLFNLGCCYENRSGNVKGQNLQQAIQCYKASANLGHSEAMYKLAVHYLQQPPSNNQAQLIENAIKLLEGSEKQGNTNAMNKLGDLYFLG